MSKKTKLKPDRIKLPPMRVHPTVNEAIRKIQRERSVPLGAAVDEIFWQLQRAKEQLESRATQLTVGATN